MRKALLILVGMFAAMNALVFFFVVRLRPQLSDAPEMIAKTATEQNWEDSIYKMAVANNRAGAREQHLMMAGYFTCFTSFMILLISLTIVLRKEQNA